ncbi:MAG: hypothetical protein KJ065_18980 [Anaerolineae bacterium]|nr:hypothetical protein [Anaerolineae bacterium]
MQPELSLIVSIAVLLGVIVTPVIAGFFSIRQTNTERKDARLQEQQMYLIETMRTLIRLRSRLQYLQDKWEFKEEVREREEAYGEAYAIMLSIPDEDIRKVTEQVMKGQITENHNEKLEAINSAILRLGNLIEATMRKR